MPDINDLYKGIPNLESPDMLHASLEKKKNFERFRWSQEKRLPGPRDFAGYVWRQRYMVLLAALIFAMFACVGVWMSDTFYGPMMNALGAQAEDFRTTTSAGMAVGIFLNNAIKCVFFTLFGIFFGFFPAFAMSVNGIVIGVIGAGVAEKHGLLYVLAGLGPHGVIELPCVFISSGIGFRFGLLAFRQVLHKFGLAADQGEPGWQREFAQGVLVLLVWIVPLLMVAALIEAFITPLFLEVVIRA